MTVGELITKLHTVEPTLEVYYVTYDEIFYKPYYHQIDGVAVKKKKQKGKEDKEYLELE